MKFFYLFLRNNFCSLGATHRSEIVCSEKNESFNQFFHWCYWRCCRSKIDRFSYYGCVLRIYQFHLLYTNIVYRFNRLTGTIVRLTLARTAASVWTRRTIITVSAAATVGLGTEKTVPCRTIPEWSITRLRPRLLSLRWPRLAFDWQRRLRLFRRSIRRLRSAEPALSDRERLMDNNNAMTNTTTVKVSEMSCIFIYEPRLGWFSA